MSEPSRKKTLPLAVLAAPALAFGSLTFAAAPAMAVPADDVEAILAEDGIDTILVYATEDATVYRDDGPNGTFPAGSPLQISQFDAEAQQFVGYLEQERYDIAPFEHATAAQYEEEGLEVPTFIQELEDEDDTENVLPEIALSTTEARIGDTVRITINNVEEVLDSYDLEDYNIIVNGDVSTGESFGIFGDAGIEQADDEDTYEFTIPDSVETDSGEIPVGEDSSFTFTATFVINPGVAGAEVYTYSTPVTLNVVVGEAPGDDETPEVEETPDPVLNVDPAEVLLEDFIGNSEEGTGVLHTVTGLAAGTEIEYAVETPANIAPFDSSAPADEDGVVEFWIHGYDTSNPSVYLGDYTTVVTYEDEDGETQRLTATFSVVEAADDGDVTPVVETEEPATETEDTETQAATAAEEEDDAAAVGSADPQLADTGASGAQLAWIAGGFLAVGGAFVIYANRARLFGRKN